MSTSALFPGMPREIPLSASAEGAPPLHCQYVSAESTSFVSYYDEYKHKVFSFLFYRLRGDRQLAEDLTSDVWLKAYEKFETYNPDYTFSTWIYAIARNTLIDHIRKHKELADLDEAKEVVDEHTESALEKLTKKERLEIIYQVLDSLPAAQKDCIILKFIDGLSTAEIAEATGFTTANVRQHLSRATKKIKQYASLFLVLFLILVTQL